MSYVACNAISGTAHVADPDELAELTWATLADLPHYVPYGLFAPVQEYLNAQLPRWGL